MAIFSQCDEEFEQGTTGTTQLVIRDDDEAIKPADQLIVDDSIVENPTVEMYNASDENDVVLSETAMNKETDNEGDVFYTKNIFIPEDQELGEYHVVHRVLVGGEKYKRTVVVDVVEVADKN